MTPVAIALGSNLGDRAATLRRSVELLSPHVSDLRTSSFHDTAPVGVDPNQPTYMNGAVVGMTALSARALLEQLLAIERVLGRTRPYPGASRTLDLDLILYGDAIIDEADLLVPHPRFRERRFVLGPLAEIAADWRDPVTGRAVHELLSALGA